MASMEFQRIESRIEWMSRPIFIGRFINPKILITDEWTFRMNEIGDEVSYYKKFYINLIINFCKFLFRLMKQLV